jgi:hypothetical protein
MLRRIFGSKRHEATGDWRRLHKKELHALYSSPHIRVIKSRRLRWAGHVARMGGNVHTEFWWENLRKGNDLEDPDGDEKIILKWILKTGDGGMYWTHLTQDRGIWRAVVNAVINLRLP